MEIKRSKYDMMVQGICMILLFGMSVYLILNWSGLPARVPAHYNAAGQIDRWASKSELWFLPIVGWILYIGITVIERFPRVWNTGVTVTEENRDRVYRTLKNLIETIKLIIISVFTLLNINSILATELPIWFLSVFLILIFGTILLFIRKLLKIK